MTFIQLLPVANRNSTISSGTRPVPGNTNLNGATIRIDCTTGTLSTPFTGFTDPFSGSSMSITISTAFSWDGGTTFPESASSTFIGESTGVWGKTMAPLLTRGIPFNSALGGRPDHYMATLTLSNGPISFGVSLEEF